MCPRTSKYVFAYYQSWQKGGADSATLEESAGGGMEGGDGRGAWGSGGERVALEGGELSDSQFSEGSQGELLESAEVCVCVCVYI
jgi:hypothetical protein